MNRRLLAWSEPECALALAEELAGPARLTHLKRIHARLNLLRARRERLELARKAVGR